MDWRSQDLSGDLPSPPHYCHPVSDDSVNDHIKDCGQQGVPLSYPAVDLEDGPVMPPYLLRHLELDPVYLQNAECTGPHSITRQDIKTAVPVQGIVGLAQVKEDGTEDRLPHGNELLKHLCLEGGSPCSYPHAKAM